MANSSGEGICQGITADGQPCRARARPSGYCVAHDPELAEERVAWSARGGQNKRTEARAAKLVPEVMRPVLHRLLRAMQQVGDGEMEPRVATAMASIAGAIVRVYEVGQLEERISALEKSNEQQTG